MRRLRPHLTYANIMVTLLAVGALTGGVAYAANTVFSTDIVNGEVKSLDIGNNQVYSADVRDDTLANGGLTGADIKNKSGVDTCEISLRIGDLCFRAENQNRTWDQALAHCGNLDMRLPTVGEATELALTHDLPNVSGTEVFWTDEVVTHDNLLFAFGVDDAGSYGFAELDQQSETACVTTPTN